MLGAFAVGKSSLVRRFVEGGFRERYLTTVGVKIDRGDVILDERSVRLMIWDIAGEDDFATVRSSYLRGVSGYLLVVDAGRRATLDTVLALHERVRAVAGDVPFRLLVNKVDLDRREIDDRALAGVVARGWQLHETSARSGAGVHPTFVALAEDLVVADRDGARIPRAAPSPPAPASARGDAVAEDALAALDTLVLERLPSGRFRRVGHAPDWAVRRLGGLAASGTCAPEEHLTFLEGFLHDAAAVWGGGSTGRVDSGPFHEGDDAVVLEATALQARGLSLLVVRRLGEAYEEQAAMLQRARDNLLVQDRLEAEVARRTHDIRRREEEIALRLVSAAESRDGVTGAHVQRIGLFSAVVARALGWSERLVDDLRTAAPMHDIGKVGIPDSILLARGPLSAEQWALLKTHTSIGASILHGSSVRLLQMAREIALSHHEWWDGSGYPRGLAGTDIPEAARIVAVVDVFDALVHERPYKPAFSEDRAIGEMRAERGTHFDPDILDAFISELGTIRRLRWSIAEDALAPAEATTVRAP